jgi:branched-chain amino acid aminotransferase
MGVGGLPVRVHINGRLVEESEAAISVFDRGFLFGDGIFESMRTLAGRVFRLDRHLARLRGSARRIALDLPVSDRALSEAVAELLQANGLAEARVRVTVTGGPGRPGDYLHAPGPPTVVMSAAPFKPLEPVLHQQGVAVVIPRRRAIASDALDPSIKSTSRLNFVLARREANQQGGFEAVLQDAAGHLTEGTASNLFLVSRDRLLTSPVPEGGLPGVTREAVIELAREAGVPVREERLPASLLDDASEVFLTNTSWEVLPVARVDGREIGGGRPGPVAILLLSRYRALVRRECCVD